MALLFSEGNLFKLSMPRANQYLHVHKKTILIQMSHRLFENSLFTWMEKNVLSNKQFGFQIRRRDSCNSASNFFSYTYVVKWQTVGELE